VSADSLSDLAKENMGRLKVIKNPCLSRKRLKYGAGSWKVRQNLCLPVWTWINLV
jgi:hypothetical protein